MLTIPQMFDKQLLDVRKWLNATLMEKTVEELSNMLFLLEIWRGVPC